MNNLQLDNLVRSEFNQLVSKTDTAFSVWHRFIYLDDNDKVMYYQMMSRLLDEYRQADKFGTFGCVIETLQLIQNTLNSNGVTVPAQPDRAGNITEANLPSELDTPEAKAIFDEARDIGLLDCDYKWLKTKQLLACFAQKMSDKLMLGKGVNSDGTSRISWQPFERLFNEKNLRLSYNDIQKTGQLPREHELIDKLFK
jgi:hypothetical protein